MRANILIVDDRPDKLLVFQAVLEDLHQTIHTASSGDDALRAVLQHDYAVILLDVNMPGLDGLETAALIRRRKKSAHTPIIFITADLNDEVHAARGYSLGAVDYISSPVVPEILRAKVKVFVDLFLLAEQAKLQAREQMAFAEERAARAAAERATRRLAFLAQASGALAASLDFAATTREVARLVVPEIADVCALTTLRVTDQDAKTELSWSAREAGATPELATATLESAPSPFLSEVIERVSANGRGEVIDVPPAISIFGANEPARCGQMNTLVVAPLPARGRTLGVLTLGLGPSGRQFEPDALSLVTDLANRAAVALDNALLYKNIRDEDRRKNEFLAMLAHELRNPLAPISNAVHLMQACADDGAKVAWCREVIGRQLKHLTRHVDDLLDVSRVTRGKIDLKIESLDVAEVVASAVETSRPNVDAQDHALTILLPPEPLRIVGDFARVAQALANVINNAAKYTDRGGRISVTAAREGNEVAFRVCDSGVGIAREDLVSIFEPFIQLEHSLARSQGGLGIGLTLVRRLVEMQGGSVTAHSAGHGTGSEFTLRFPLDEAPAAGAPSVGEDALGLQPTPLIVLVVDDNRDVAESTAMVLRTAGHDVHVAYDGTTALAAVARTRPDAVLLDLGLPGMDGFSVAQHIRRDPAFRRTLLVAVSGYGQDDHRVRSRQAGFDYHVVKPIGATMITQLLGTLRSHRSPSVENVVTFPARRAGE